jgi:hypothetical protein
MIDQLSALSPEIRNLYPGCPKKGEERIYQLMNISQEEVSLDPKNLRKLTKRLRMPNTYTLPKSYVIYDYIKQEKVKIELIKTTMPTGPNAVRPTINIPGRVTFSAFAMCEIRVNEDNYKELMEIDKFLFFTPWLEQNQDQKFNIRHSWGPIYTLKDKKSVARKSVDEAKFVTFAHAKLLEMSKEEIAIICSALKLGNESYSYEEQIDSLMKFYSKPENAKTFQALTEDNEIRLRALIKESQKVGIIRVDGSGSRWIWSKGEETISTKYPGKTMEDSLLLFFATPEGREVSKILFDIVKEEHGKAVKKVHGKPKVEKPDDEPTDPVVNADKVNQSTP